MKRFYILIFLLLAACAPATSTVNPAYELERAKVEAQYYEAQLTATAQAPILEVTRAAAAVEMTRQVQNLQGTQTAIPLTSTAQMWTPTVTPTPTINVTGTIAVEQMNADIRQMELETTRRERTNTALAFAPYFVGILTFALLLWFGFVGSRRLQMMPTPVHENGRSVPMINVVDGVAWNPDQFANGMGVVKREYVNALPEITGARQDMVNQMVLAKLPRRLPEPTATSMPEAPKQIAAGVDAGAFPLPDWSSVRHWSPVKDNLPLGVSANGLQTWDLNIQAHLAVFGMTRSGKDQRMMRPLVAFMLASGHQVLLIGKEIDFLPHLGHPNLVFVPVHDVTEPEEAAKYANALAACVAEKNNRIKYMAKRGVALWDGPRTFVALGELSNAMKEMESGMADYAMSKTTSVVNEGGKAGMNLVFSAQRPKGFRDLTTQCGRVVFQVETDEERGYALGMKDAYKLPEVPTGYFYRKWHGLQTLGGFQPTDDEIREFLGKHMVQAMPKPDWIDGKFIEPTPQAPLIAPKTDLEALAESYLSEYEPGMSGQAIGRMIGKPYGGSWKEKIDQLREVFDRLSGQHQISEGVV